MYNAFNIAGRFFHDLASIKKQLSWKPIICCFSLIYYTLNVGFTQSVVYDSGSNSVKSIAVWIFRCKLAMLFWKVNTNKNLKEFYLYQLNVKTYRKCFPVIFHMNSYLWLLKVYETLLTLTWSQLVFQFWVVYLFAYPFLFSKTNL